jgi:hypothetical protein
MTVGGAASVMPAEAARQTCRGARSHPTSRSPAVSLVVHAPQQDEEQHERDDPDGRDDDGDQCGLRAPGRRLRVPRLRAPACVESGRCSHGADEPPDAAGAPAGRGGQVGRAPRRPGVPVGARPEPTPPIESVKRPARSATLANGIGSTFAPSEDSPVSSRVKAISRGRDTRPRSSERSATTSRRSCEDPSGSPPAAGTFLRNDDGRGKLRGYGGGRRGHGRPATRR